MKLQVSPMTLKPLGDSAWLVEFPGLAGEAARARVAGLVAALEIGRLPGVRDVVPSFDTVAVHFHDTDGIEIREWIGAAAVADRLPEGREIEVPVIYDGADLEQVAALTEMSVAAVVAMHSGAVYTVAAVGFAPGFPYLSGLPLRLHVPRLSVPAGSVAMAGGQAGIYPCASPGGWHLLGRTGLRLFDPRQVPPALLRCGDRVRFVTVDALEAVEEISDPEISVGRIEVVEPGSLTTVQDLGRSGYESAGVSPGGAVDRQALRQANLIVGNPPGAAALEACMCGPVLKFHAPAVVAWAGKSRLVETGETVDFSKLAGGLRAYLSVAGGLRVPDLLGSAATDLRAGFGGHGGRALRAGDRLEFGEPGRIPTPGDWQVGRGGRVPEIVLRFLPGAQGPWFSDAARMRFRTEAYRVTADSDRMGARLSGPPLELAEPREMISQPVACGSVQVPPDGQPIVLLAGRQTIGGYPQIGHVISVDLPKLAGAWPGAVVRFREVTWEEAQVLKFQAERDLKWLRTGLDPLSSRPCV